MKSRFASFIMIGVMILIICALVLLGVIFLKEINGEETSSVPQDFVGNYTSNDDTVDLESIKTPQVIENNPLDSIESSNNNNVNIDYSNVTIDKYFYNQLEEPSKTIYKALETNKENMITGTYKIEFGNAFSDILDSPNGQNELGDYYQSAIEAYTYDNPDVFYLSPSKMYLNIETTTYGSNTTYNVFINNGSEANYLQMNFQAKHK